MRTLGLDHVSLTVADLDRSVAFYHDLLGIPILGRGEETASGASSISGLKGAHFLFVDLDLGSGQILELLQYLRPKSTRRSRSGPSDRLSTVALRRRKEARPFHWLRVSGGRALRTLAGDGALPTVQ